MQQSCVHRREKTVLVSTGAEYWRFLESETRGPVIGGVSRVGIERVKPHHSRLNSNRCIGASSIWISRGWVWGWQSEGEGSSLWCIFFRWKSHSLKCFSLNGHHMWSLCRGVTFSQPCEHILREISEFCERREEWQNQVLRWRRFLVFNEVWYMERPVVPLYLGSKVVFQERSRKIAHRKICSKLRGVRGYDRSRMAIYWEMCNFVPDAKFTREGHYFILEVNFMGAFYGDSTSFLEETKNGKTKWWEKWIISCWRWCNAWNG